MKYKNSKVLASLKDLESIKKIQLMINSALAISVVMLTFMVAIEDTVAVVTPAHFSQELRVSHNQANEHYKVRWAWSAASLAGNINDKNADFVVDELGRMFSPYLKTAILPSIRREVQIVAARKAEQRFAIEDAIYEPQNDVVFIWGYRELRLDNNTTPVKERWTYEFRIEPFTGRPAITHFDSYPGPPRSKNPKYKVEYNPMLPAELEDAIKSTNPEASVKQPAANESNEAQNDQD
ncbi:hypothetical protein C9975_04785 [Thalassospira xiamenensis]|nr:hypothetical protein C9975_04785 [Thalassospira xiamenensis]